MRKTLNYLTKLIFVLVFNSLFLANSYGKESSSPARFLHSTVYDFVSKQVIVFGGTGQNGQLLSDLWSYDIEKKSWQEIETKGKKPLARKGHSAIYDPSTKQMIVFGGLGQTGFLSDLWAYDVEKNTWEKVEIEGEKPSARGGHTSMFVPHLKQMIVFGGEVDIPFSDLWIYDMEKKTWKEIETDEHPPARNFHSSIYDSASKQMLIFGGAGDKALLSDLWAYNVEKKTWEEIEVEKGTLPRSAHSAIYDSDTHQMIVFGGAIIQPGQIASDLWVYNIDRKTWKEISTEEKPSARYNHTSIYDSATKQMIMFSGATLNMVHSDLWAYNIEKKAWRKLEIEEKPIARVLYTSVYTSTLNQIFIFGGLVRQPLSDLWAYDIKKRIWQEMKVEKEISARSSHTSIYDISSKKIIVFGGGNQDNKPLSDMWSYNVEKNSWEKIKTEGEKPTARGAHSAVYDSDLKQMIIFGGLGEGRLLSDLWTYDIEKNKWEEIATEEQPPARRNHISVYDPSIKQVIIFGGIDQNMQCFSDLWAFNIEKKQWKEVRAKGKLPPRYFYSSIYNPDTKQIVIFGGQQSGFLSDLWTYDIEKKTWTEILVTGEKPSARSGSTAIYNSDNPKMIILGGTGQGGDYSDMWAYDFKKNEWEEIILNGIFAVEVTDASNRHIEDAEVKILKDGKEISKGKTDKDGVYTSEPLELRNYNIVITKSGLQEQTFNEISVRTGYKKYIYATLK